MSQHTPLLVRQVTNQASIQVDNYYIHLHSHVRHIFNNPTNSGCAITNPYYELQMSNPMLVNEARFVRRHHVFNVDVGIVSTISLQKFQGLVHQVSYVHLLVLAVIYTISCVSWKKNYTGLDGNGY